MSTDAKETEQPPEEHDAHPIVFALIAIVVGVATGIGALAFHHLIAFFHNLFFYGRLTTTLSAESLLEPSPWGPFIILAPVIGGLGVVWLTRTFAPEARGSGVPEVIDAVYFRDGLIRPVVAAARSLASALSIGSGASVGKEGPVIQIGASLASTIARLVHLSSWQRITLIAAGAGGGIAAIFNTPLGGVMFAIELILPELSVRTFLPVVLTTATATYIGRMALGMTPAFAIPAPEAVAAGALDFHNLVAMSALGILCGLAAWFFIRLQSITETIFQGFASNLYLRHSIGMLLVGIILFSLQQFYGHYHVAGANYVTISDILHGNLLALQLLVVLFLAKLVATALSLGSGASGGIFSPALFLGATLGAAFGTVLSLLWPDAGIDPMDYAVIGMASVVGGVTGAAMTAIVMVFEMTRDYAIIVPLIIAVALAIGVRRALIEETIYTLKLAQRGKHFSGERHRNLSMFRHAEDFIEESIAVLPASLMVPAAFERLGRDPDVHYLILSDAHGMAHAVLPFEALLNAEHEGVATETRIDQLAAENFVVARARDSLSDAIQLMTSEERDYALVIPDGMDDPVAGSVLGIMDKDHLGDSVMEQFRTFSAGT